MAEIVISCTAKLLEYMVNPILNQFKYLFCHTSIIQNLNSELENLENKRIGVELLVDAAKRNAEVVGPDVLEWLQKVDDLKNDVDVQKIAANSEMQCLYLKCPNLKLRHWQSKKATVKTTTVVELQKKEFQRVGYPTPPKQMPTEILHDFEDLGTRISTRKEIVKALKDEEINIVGICGMPGVGKTTMANEVAYEVKNFFDEVAIAIVSKDPDIKKIQNQIAEALGKKIEEQENERVRAGRLHERLTYDGHKKILVILDDVWKKVDLQRIGITSKGDRKGLKILLTSRFKAVCVNMGAGRNIYEVDVLPENEASKLFKDAAGISNDTSELVKGLATDVAKECGGLPLSLLIVGTSLKNKEEYAWRDALRQLRNSNVTNIEGIHDEVYKSIAFSYNYLKPEEAKSLVLLCSLFPEDQSIPIETLVRYARGLMLFRDTALLSQTRDRIFSIIHDLKSCYMLLSGEEDDEVKLHDVVRDFCLLVASKDEHIYMVKHTGLKEWPKQDSYDSYSAISLTFDGLNELPKGLEYPNLKLLRLVNQSEVMNISGDIFSKMSKLRVLDFNSTDIQVPSSLQSLTSLQTLCLDDCNVEIQISAIGGLKNLETLSFYGSCLSYFPNEIAELSNLKSLDLRFERGPRPLPRGVLSSLKKLEELYLGSYFQTWLEERKDEELEEYIITEISSLTELNTFQICTPDPEFLMQILQTMRLEKLQRFQIILNTETKRRRTGDYHFGRSLHLQVHDARVFSEPVIYSLMRGIDDFILGVWDSNNIFIELAEDGFVNLKKLLLWFSGFEYLIDATDFTPSGLFNNLEHLCLFRLDSLIAICKGNLPPGAFARLQVLNLEYLPIMEYLWNGVIKPPLLCNLRILKMTRCVCIKSLFPESIAKCLANLQSVDISDCPALEEIASSDTKENEVTEMIEFQKLKHLKLSLLRNFKSLRSESNASNKEKNPAIPKPLLNQVLLPNLEVLELYSLWKLAKILGDEIQVRSLYNLRVMTVESCHNLLDIAQSDAIKLLQNLESLEVKNCEKIEVLFDFEGLTLMKDHTASTLGQLRSLKLIYLPKLVNFTKIVPKGICVFENLRSISLLECGSLRYLFPPSMANLLVHLETLSLKDCEAFEEIIEREEEETSEIKMEEQLFDETDEGGVANKIMLPKLSNLHLIGLVSLRTLCSRNLELVFPSLHNLILVDCPMIEKLCTGKLSARKLKKVNIGNGQSVDISDFPVPGSRDINV